MQAPRISGLWNERSGKGKAHLEKGDPHNGKDTNRMLQREEEVALATLSETCPFMQMRGHRDLKSHQKGHIYVYYIEKRERKSFQRI